MLDILIKLGVSRLFYLCADNHSFQNITFTYVSNDRQLSIQQIISGTGGAKLDYYTYDIKPDYQFIGERFQHYYQSLTENNLKSFTVHDYQPTFGYTDCRVDLSGVQFDFHQIPYSMEEQYLNDSEGMFAQYEQIHYPIDETVLEDTHRYKYSKYKAKYLNLKNIWST